MVLVEISAKACMLDGCGSHRFWRQATAIAPVRHVGHSKCHRRASVHSGKQAGGSKTPGGGTRNGRATPRETETESSADSKRPAMMPLDYAGRDARSAL